MFLLSLPKYALWSMVFFFSAVNLRQATIIEGKVFWENTNTPAANVYVYITEGVEEDLTDKDGNFSIRTWKKLPAELLFRYQGNKTFKVTIRESNKKHSIWLKKQ